MKIGFFGDSFCAGTPEHDIYGVEDNGNYSQTSWPSIATSLVTGSMVCHCQSGDTLWHTYEYLCDSIKDYDVVIICVSDPIRTPNKYRIPTIGKQFDKVLASISIKEEEIKQYAQYLDLKLYFEPKEYKYAAQIGVLVKIDELIKLHNKKALIIPSFDNSLQGYKFNNATVVNLNLNEDVKNRSLEKNNLLKVDNLDRVNHMFKKENTVFAQAIADYILNQDSSKEINFKKYFKYLDN